VPPWRFFYWNSCCSIYFSLHLFFVSEYLCYYSWLSKKLHKKFKENVPLTVVPKAFHKHVLNFHYS
jgi:hypothetical protein